MQKSFALPAQRADRFKTTQVRTHQNQSVAVGNQLAQCVLAMNLEIKQIESAIEKIDAVVNGGSKSKNMDVPVPPAGAATQSTSKILA